MALDGLGRLGALAEETYQCGEGPHRFEDDEGVELDEGGGEQREGCADEVEDEVGSRESVHDSIKVEDEGDEDEADADRADYV